MSLKKVDNKKNPGLSKLPEDVRNKMGYAAHGMEVRGYGAARTKGMGLQDENLQPGKSMDYYKDLI